MARTFKKFQEGNYSYPVCIITQFLVLRFPYLSMFLVQTSYSSFFFGMLLAGSFEIQATGIDFFFSSTIMQVIKDGYTVPNAPFKGE